MTGFNIKIIPFLLILSTLSTFAAAAETAPAPRPPREKAFVVKAGYFTSNETERMAGNHDLSFDGSYALAMEYFKVWRNDVAFSVSAMYSEPDLVGRVWDEFNGAWVAAHAEVNVRQFAINYIRFGGSVKSGIEKYEGGYYGVGVGFSDYSVSNRLAADGSAVEINQGLLEENSLDFNLILGYKFSNRFGVDAKWILDEKAMALFGGYWY